MASFGSYRLGVELYAMQRKFAVGKAHYGAVLKFCSHPQRFRQRRTLYDKGVIARCGYGVGETSENA